MKKAVFSLLTVFCIAFMFFSCGKNDEINKELPMTGQLVGSSACKSNLKSSSLGSETPDTLSCVAYAFDPENNKLTLKHINAALNCCPNSVYCTIELHGDTILIQEFETSALCNCNCLYDLDIEITGVDLKKYLIQFIEPYASEQSKLLFAIDLTQNTQGSFCVTRKLYPWGMNDSFTPSNNQ
jgi:hypothetical protein